MLAVKNGVKKSDKIAESVGIQVVAGNHRAPGQIYIYSQVKSVT